MREGQHGACTLKSHGVAVAKSHMHDWLILILLVVILIILYFIHPFYRFVGKEMMDDLKYPLKSNTIPVWAVPIYSVLLPVIIFLGFYFRRRDVYDLHHGVLGILFSVVITAIFTNVLKLSVGRPRPNFFWRCFPNGKDIYDHFGNVICHGKESEIKEGHKSFPSGHTSCIVVATFCYLQFFPPPYHVHGWGTYAYLRMLEELQPTSQPSHVVNNPSEEVTEEQAVNSQASPRNNGFMGLSVENDTNPTLDDIESGRR